MDPLLPTDLSSTAELDRLEEAYGLGKGFAGRIDRYVAWEWSRARHIFQSPLIGMNGRQVFELGCNLGATSVVMASLGARVQAVDIDPKYVETTAITARRYGLSDRISVQRSDPGSIRLPFPDASFDRICCNSVLEYVADPLLEPLMGELDRLLRPGGVLCVLGTSNRLCPREVHSHRWLVNYWPKSWDRLFRADGGHFQRGLWSWTIRRAFAGYLDLDRQDRSRSLLRCRAQMGDPAWKLAVMGLLRWGAATAGVGVGTLFPSIQMTLRKPGADAPDSGLARSL